MSDKSKTSLRINENLKADALKKYDRYGFTFTQIIELALLKLLEEDK